MRILGWLLLAVCLLLVSAGGAAWVIYTRAHEAYQGYAGGEQFVEVPAGAGPAAIGRRLVDAGVVRDALTFRVAVAVSGRARDLKAGEYRFDQPISAVAVVERIARGDVYRRLLTFREGLTIEEMARVYEARGFGDADAFLAAARDPAPVAALDPAAQDLEGYLFPETYALARRTPAAELVRTMVSHFERAFDQSLRAEAEAQGLTVRQVVTLAALVEKETARAEERPIVAAVYRNRLRIGMGLQADPTVIYALQRAGRYTGNLTRADLQFDSPYNTYRYAGLPPGPIAAPGRASIEAVVRPADVTYLYFVSRNDGSHVFAETLAEHNRNVREWQVLYFRKQR
ncbi:MAG: endolytic transglycosylase MltG [Acidobacteriota bacterium]